MEGLDVTGRGFGERVSLPRGPEVVEISVPYDLRDWFAGTVMVSLVRNSRDEDALKLAKRAYKYANALLEARDVVR